LVRLAPTVNNGRVTEDQEQDQGTLRPVVTGLLALAAVALAVGLILGGVALVGSRMLGLSDGDDTAGAGASNNETLYLPRFERTTDSGPDITLGTQEPTDESTAIETEPTKTESTESKSPEQGEISLQAVQREVSAGENIDFTGVYPGGEGAILQVQRFEGGGWVDFDATIPVSNETFSTYIFTGVTGEQRFRVIDNSTGVASNEVHVRVS
jgi:hypothetical protein